MKRSYRKAVFVVTYRKEKNKLMYLVLKRKLHWTGWEFPKGGIEKGETRILTIVRELKEETGLSPANIINHHVHGKYKFPKFLKDRPFHIGHAYSLFSAEVKSKKVKIDNYEHSGYKWLNYKEAVKILNWPDQKQCLKIVDNYLNRM